VDTPRPSPRTNRTRRVTPPVLIGPSCPWQVACGPDNDFNLLFNLINHVEVRPTALQTPLPPWRLAARKDDDVALQTPLPSSLPLPSRVPLTVAALSRNTAAPLHARESLTCAQCWGAGRHRPASRRAAAGPIPPPKAPYYRSACASPSGTPTFSRSKDDFAVKWMVTPSPGRGLPPHPRDARAGARRRGRRGRGARRGAAPAGPGDVAQLQGAKTARTDRTRLVPPPYEVDASRPSSRTERTRLGGARRSAPHPAPLLPAPARSPYATPGL